MLPQYQSQDPYPGGLSGPNTSAAGFATGAANASLLTGGIQDAARGVAAFGLAARRSEANKRDKADRLQRLEDSLWVGEAAQRLNKELTDFAVDPKNYNKPTFPTDYLDRANALRKTAESAAPSKEAFVALASSYDGAVTRQYDDAVNTATRVRIDRAGESVTNQVRLATESFRVARELNPDAALRELGVAEATIIDTIDEAMGEVAPKMAAAQKELVTKEIFASLVDDEPELALDYAKKSNHIDEQTRRVMVNDAKRQIGAAQVNGRASFDEVRAASINAARSGELRAPIPVEQYTAFYGDKAAEVKRSDDIQIVGTNKAYLAFQETKGMRPDVTAEKVTAAQAAAAATNDPQVQVYAEQLTRMYAESVKQYKADPVRWMVDNHPGVASVASRYRDNPDDKEAARDLATRLLEYQGRAPEGASEEVQSYFHGMPEHAKRLLGKQQASQLASTINNADPATVVETIRQAVDMFPGYEALVLRDLVTSEDPIKQEYQLAFSNAGFSFAQDYVSSIKNEAAITKLTDERRADIDAAVRNHPTFLALSEATLGSYDQSSGQLAGFMNGIASFATLKISRGMPMKAAVNSAIGQLVSTTLGFTRVNGQALGINKVDSADNVIYDDDAVHDIGRRLSVALSEIDPRGINVDGFQVNEIYKDASEHVKHQAIRDQITSSSFFRMNGDGQSVSLYIKDIHGSPRMVMDNDGTPVVINFADLPEYTRDVDVPNVSGNTVAQNVKTQPKKTYPLYKEFGSDLFGNYRVETNWPTRPAWIK